MPRLAKTMPKCSKTLALILAASLLVLLAPGPAGTAEPQMMRIATLSGIKGLVYYSLAEGRYRLVGRDAATAGRETTLAAR